MKLSTTDGNPWATGTRLDDAGADARGWGWFKGNLHCHTTRSDGRLSPQETVAWFASAGYQFLALTDHNVVTDPMALDSHGLCLLPSTELTASGGQYGASYHLIGLGVAPASILPPATTPAVEAVAWMRAQGAAVFIAHPYWSGLSVEDLLRPMAHGIEIYNGGTVLDSQKGEAVFHWDEGWARGARWWGIAVDDTHWHTLDRGLGWIMVRAPERSPTALLEAIIRGHFYASSGPEIRHVEVTEDGDRGAYVSVETSPCAAIYLLGHGSRNQFAVEREAAARGEAGATLTTARFHVSAAGPGNYVRVQCVDWQRRCAWSNPLRLV